jgi:hypothetical protein
VTAFLGEGRSDQIEPAKTESKLKATGGILSLLSFSSLFRMCKLHILKEYTGSDPVSGHHHMHTLPVGTPP